MNADDILFLPIGENTILGSGFHFLYLDKQNNLRVVSTIDEANQIVHCRTTQTLKEIKQWVIDIGPATREVMENFMEQHQP
jgi:hypothetical protein